jgi:hypothetical protein
MTAKLMKKNDFTAWTRPDSQFLSMMNNSILERNNKMQKWYSRSHFSLYIGCLVMLITAFAPMGLSAQSKVGDVWFDEPSITVTGVGRTFVTNLRVNTGTAKLGAVTFVMDFDASVVAVDTAYGDGGNMAAESGYTLIPNPNKTGKFTISGFKVAGAKASTALALLSIGWKAVGKGSTTITNNVTSLSNESGNTIGTPRGMSIKVTVGSVITNTPTVTPIVAPKTTSARIPTSTPTGHPPRRSVRPKR